MYFFNTMDILEQKLIHYGYFLKVNAFSADKRHVL